MSKHIESSEIIPCGPSSDKKFKDISGQRFGRWTAIRVYGKRLRKYGWSYFLECVCDCGATGIIQKNSLVSGDSSSCGCFQSEYASRRLTTHGLSRSREYISYQSMWLRCTDPGSVNWTDYGGRGITVCDRWKDFATFYADMGPKPSAKHSIDRIDNDGHYEPSNCRWATNSQQARNRRGNRHITFRGETKLVVEWSEELGLNLNLIYDRLRYGWSPERALTQPKGVYRKSQAAVT